MANEAAKAYQRLSPLLVGKGLDIGCGNDPIISNCDRWDWAQGDAQYLAGIEDDTYDWIFSSHLLEHVKNPGAAVARWWKTLRVGGYLILLVPDEDLYEQGVWPSRFNADHKHTFTLSKYSSWSPASVSLVDLLNVLPGHRLVNLSVADSGYDYSLDGGDQTSGVAEAACQMIVKKECFATSLIPTKESLTVTYSRLDGSYYDPTTGS